MFHFLILLDLADFKASNFNMDAAIAYVHFNLSTEALFWTRVMLGAIGRYDNLEAYVTVSGNNQITCRLVTYSFGSAHLGEPM